MTLDDASTLLAVANVMRTLVIFMQRSRASLQVLHAFATSHAEASRSAALRASAASSIRQ